MNNGGCRNDAQCENDYGNFTCNCKMGYSGRYCEICMYMYKNRNTMSICMACNFYEYIIVSVVGGCPNQPCRNEGSCIPDEDSFYMCDCTANLSGQNCTESELHGFKYLVMDELLTWEEASEDCVSRGYSLTSVTSADEMSHLTTFVR